MADSAHPETRRRHVLRSIGLSILPRFAEFILGLFGVDWTLFRPFSDEPAKPIVRKSKYRGSALARCLVHILPIMASTAIITLNLCHLFLGGEFPGIIHDTDISTALLQVAAKIQELLILSSLATIVFHRICDDLISDDGLSLGFLCSGFTFSQLNYFWSPEFWGAVKGEVRWGRKWRILLLLVVTGLLAVTAGPSVAVLIIPRDQSWEAGGSDFFLRGSEDQLFPKILNSSSLDAPLECLGRDAVQYGYCPAGGFNALKNYVSQVSMIKNGENYQEPLPIRLFGVFSTQYIDVASVTRGMPLSKLVGSVRGVACQTAVVGTFLPAVMYQNKLLNDWKTIIGNIPFGRTTMSTAEYRYFSGAPSTTTSIYIPAVRTACSEAQDLPANGLGVLFPVMPSSSCPRNFQKLHSISQLAGLVPSTSLRTTWVSLPQNFGGGAASSGLMTESPWSTDNSSRVVIACTVDARWVKGTVENGRGMVESNSLANEGEWGNKADHTTPFRPLADHSWDKITLNETWLRLLTPVAAAQDASENMGTQAQNTFEALLAMSAISDGFEENLGGIERAASWNSHGPGLANRTIYLEWLTTLLVADGLSRYGSHRALDRSGPPTSWDLLDYVKTSGNFDEEILRGGRALFPPYGTNYTTYKAKITIQGLSYLAHTTTDWLSMAVLFIHILLAFLHTGYVLWYGESSTAWDSITELLTLTLNSRPQLADLENTSAGIYCLKTFGKGFVIRSTAVEPDGSSTEAEKPADERQPARHVELIPRDQTHPTDSKADRSHSGEAQERVSGRRPSLLPNFARPFAPYRAPYPDHQHEQHWGPDLSPSRDSEATRYSKQPLLAEGESSPSSSSTSPSSSSSSPSSRKRRYRTRNRMLRYTNNDDESFEKIVPNQVYA